MKKSTKLVSAVVVLAVLGGVYVGLNTYVSKEEKDVYKRQAQGRAPLHTPGPFLYSAAIVEN